MLSRAGSIKDQLPGLSQLWSPPSPVPLTPFSIAMGGQVATIDVFNHPDALNSIVLGVTGRTYTYDPVLGRVTIHQGPNTKVVALATGSVFASSSGYGYVIAYAVAAVVVSAAFLLRPAPEAAWMTRGRLAEP